MGENKWRDEQEWPLARTKYTPWYLGRGGHWGRRSRATTSGRMASPTTPGTRRRPSVAACSAAGEVAGPVQQSQLSQRADVLTYTSEPLAAPMEVTGPLWVDLWAATDAARHRLYGRAGGRPSRRPGVEPL